MLLKEDKLAYVTKKIRKAMIIASAVAMFFLMFSFLQKVYAMERKPAYRNTHACESHGHCHSLRTSAYRERTVNLYPRKSLYTVDYRRSLDSTGATPEAGSTNLLNRSNIPAILWLF